MSERRLLYQKGYEQLLGLRMRVQVEHSPEGSRVRQLPSMLLSAHGVQYDRAEKIASGMYGVVVRYRALSEPDLALKMVRLGANRLCQEHVESEAEGVVLSQRRGCRGAFLPARVLIGTPKLTMVVMPCASASLAHLPPQSPSAAAELVLQVAWAVSAAWRAAVPYTDIKAANAVMWHGHVWLVDMGAMALEGDDGACTFPPPELASTGGLVAPTVRTLLWVLGVMLVRLELGGQDAILWEYSMVAEKMQECWKLKTPGWVLHKRQELATRIQAVWGSELAHALALTPEGEEPTNLSLALRALQKFSTGLYDPLATIVIPATPDSPSTPYATESPIGDED